MTKALKSNGQTVKILKQYRNQSNNYKSDDSRVYADLFQVKFNDNSVGILCETELS